MTTVVVTGPPCDTPDLAVPRRRVGALGGRSLALGGGCVAFALAVGFLRYRIMAAGHVPPTIDTGNWLGFGRDLLGPTLRPGSVYPPLVPLLVTTAVAAFGLVAGVSLVGALASLAPAAALLVVLRARGAGWWAVGLSGLVLVAGATGEATAWGGFPQLIGTAFAVLFLWRLDVALRQGTPTAGLTAGLLLGAVLATSHLIAAFAGLAGLLMAAGHLLFSVSPDHPRRRMVGTGLWVVLPALPYLPLYVRLAGTVLRSVGERPATAPAVNGLHELEFIYRDAALLWRPVLVAAVLILVVLAPLRRNPLWLLSASMFLASILLTWAANEPRFLYLLGMAAAPAIALWALELRTLDPNAHVLRTVAAAALVVGVVVQTVTGLGLFRVQRQYYGILRPGTVSAIRWIQDRTPGSAVVAVSPLREAPVGWWVEGVARRRTLYASPLRWLNFPGERERTRLANRIFVPTFPREDGIELACASGVSHILLVKEWGGFDRQALRGLERDHPGVVVLENADALLLSTTGAGCPG